MALSGGLNINLYGNGRGVKAVAGSGYFPFQ
jgi:hypothetical protein